MEHLIYYVIEFSFLHEEETLIKGLWGKPKTRLTHLYSKLNKSPRISLPLYRSFYFGNSFAIVSHLVTDKANFYYLRVVNIIHSPINNYKVIFLFSIGGEKVPISFKLYKFWKRKIAFSNLIGPHNSIHTILF